MDCATRSARPPSSTLWMLLSRWRTALSSRAIWTSTFAVEVSASTYWYITYIENLFYGNIEQSEISILNTLMVICFKNWATFADRVLNSAKTCRTVRRNISLPSVVNQSLLHRVACSCPANILITDADKVHEPGGLSCRDAQEGHKNNSTSASCTLTQLSHYTIMLFIC